MLVEAAYEQLHQLFKDTSRCGLQTENEKTDFSRVPDPSEDAGGRELSNPFPGLQGTPRDADSEQKEIGR